VTRNLTPSELDGIASRADLAFTQGDHEALRAEDVADLITEIRELWALRRHLIALNRQALVKLGEMGDIDTPADAEPDPP
jgi:hypothetical protein